MRTTPLCFGKLREVCSKRQPSSGPLNWTNKSKVSCPLSANC